MGEFYFETDRTDKEHEHSILAEQTRGTLTQNEEKVFLYGVLFGIAFIAIIGCISCNVYRITNEIKRMNTVTIPMDTKCVHEDFQISYENQRIDVPENEPIVAESKHIHDAQDDKLSEAPNQQLSIVDENEIVQVNAGK